MLLGSIERASLLHRSLQHAQMAAPFGPSHKGRPAARRRISGKIRPRRSFMTSGRLVSPAPRASSGSHV